MLAPLFGAISMISSNKQLLECNDKAIAPELQKLDGSDITVTMELKKHFKGLLFFWKGLKAAKTDMWASLQALVMVTLVLGTILYFVEHEAQPDVYAHWYDPYVWGVMSYLGNPGKFSPGEPITICGRSIAIIISIIKILIFAVPAGLVANGFRKAMADDKRARQLDKFRTRLTMAFQTKQCRYTKYQAVPRYRSVVDIQATQQLDTRDIIDAVNDGANFRLRNLASTQNVSEHPQDKLVVEHFVTTPGTSYGCCIDRHSRITIVSTSSVAEAGIANFAYYIALFGGFNFVSKEVEVNPDEPVSFYVVNNPEDEGSNIAAFIRDLKRLAQGNESWTIFLLSASGAEEPSYPTHFHYIYGAKRGDEGYTDPNLTIIDTVKFDDFYQTLSAHIETEFGYTSDRHRYHTGAGQKNIARRIGGGQEVNAFTLRVAFGVTIWDDRHIAIAKAIAQAMKTMLAGEEFAEDDAWKVKQYGY